MATEAPTIEDMRAALIKKQQEGLAVQPKDTSESTVTLNKEPTLEEMRASLIAQQEQQVSPVQALSDVTNVAAQVQKVAPVVPVDLDSDLGVATPTDADGEEITPSKGLSIDIYTAMANAGVNIYSQSQEAGDALMSKWQGEIASIPGAIKGAEFAAKLPIGDIRLKALATLLGSAGGAGVTTFFGELGEDAYNGTPLEYKEALEAGATTAAWDAGGGLVLKGIGTITSTALRSAGITSTGDAVKAARELLQRHGTDLSWHQATGSTLSSLVEGIAVVGIGGKKILDDAFKGREAALKQELDTFLSGGNQQQFGKGLVNIVKKTNKVLRETFNPQYTRIYEQGRDIPVYALSYNNKIQKQIAARHGAEKAGSAVEPNKLIKGANGVLTNLKKITNVAELSSTIKKLNFIKRQADDLGKTVEGKETGASAVAYINAEIKELKSMLAEASKKLKPELKSELDLLDLTYARQKQLLQSQTMKKIMTEKPSEMGALVYNSPETAGDFMRFLGAARKQGVLTKAGHKKVLEEYRSGYIKTLLKVEGDGASVSDMAGLYSTLRGTKELAQLKSVLGGPQANRLLTVLKTANIVKQHEAGKFGLMMASGLSKSAQAAAAFTVGGYTGLGALLIAPQALARAAGSARTLGQWLSLTRMYKATKSKGNRDSIALATKRITQWVNADPEDTPVRTSARQVPTQQQQSQQGMLTSAR